MKSLLYGIAVLPFLATLAAAEPQQLSNNQMDQVTAGFRLLELEVFNTGSVVTSVYGPAPLAPCANCYLNIRSATVDISAFMPTNAIRTNPFPPFPGP